MSYATIDIRTDLEVADELIRHIRDRTTDQTDSELRIPVEHFISPQRATAEIGLMRRLPLVIGHIAEIKNPGDFITRNVLDTPLIVVRRADGSVATYRNMCRHRGGVVEQTAAGNKRAFTCQYHGWSYRAEDGSLNRVFYQESYGDMDYDCSALLQVNTEVRHGLIFITFNPDEAAPSIADYLGPDVDRQIDPWNLSAAFLAIDKTFTKSINWKLVMDGAIDPLHPQFLHNKPGGVGARSVTNTSVFRAWGRHGKMFAPRAKLKTLVVAGEPPIVNSKYVGSVMVLYPNTLFVEAPEHVELWTVWPTIGKPGECTVRIRFFVRAEIMSPEMEARVNKSWGILEQAALEEDFPMEAKIQQNAESLHTGVFRYGRNEKPPQHLHTELRKDLG
jgi:phenylpropionate dioxygenase-like ring-hydroxylating dioxygenase large terminal subunit